MDSGKSARLLRRQIRAQKRNRHRIGHFGHLEMSDTQVSPTSTSTTSTATNIDAMNVDSETYVVVPHERRLEDTSNLRTAVQSSSRSPHNEGNLHNTMYINLIFPTLLNHLYN